MTKSPPSTPPTSRLPTMAGRQPFRGCRFPTPIRVFLWSPSRRQPLRPLREAPSRPCRTSGLAIIDQFDARNGGYIQPRAYAAESGHGDVDGRRQFWCDRYISLRFQQSLERPFKRDARKRCHFLQRRFGRFDRRRWIGNLCSPRRAEQIPFSTSLPISALRLTPSISVNFRASQHRLCRPRFRSEMTR